MKRTKQTADTVRESYHAGKVRLMGLECKIPSVIDIFKEML